MAPHGIEQVVAREQVARVGHHLAEHRDRLGFQVDGVAGAAQSRFFRLEAEFAEFVRVVVWTVASHSIPPLPRRGGYR